MATPCARGSERRRRPTWCKIRRIRGLENPGNPAQPPAVGAGIGAQTVAECGAGACLRVSRASLLCVAFGEAELPAFFVVVARREGVPPSCIAGIPALRSLRRSGVPSSSPLPRFPPWPEGPISVSPGRSPGFAGHHLCSALKGRDRFASLSPRRGLGIWGLATVGGGAAPLAHGHHLPAASRRTARCRAKGRDRRRRKRQQRFRMPVPFSLPGCSLLSSRSLRALR
jgi:hypothetical protein